MIRRKAFLNQRCKICGSRINRMLLGEKKPHDHQAGEIFTTQILDICEGPTPHISRDSTQINWPCLALEEIVDRWPHSLSRQEFDEQVDAVLRQGGSSQFLA